MRKTIQISLGLALGCLPLALSAQTPFGIPGNWTSTFNEDFNSTYLDGNQWRVGEHWAGMNGSGENDPAMLSITGGIASLKSQQRSWTFGGVTRSYAGTEISTFKTFRQLYGYFEARVKFPAVTGIWPAFWLMPDRATYGNADGYHRSYIKFDLTGFSGTVTSATLKLTASAANASSANNVLVMKLRDDTWAEGTLTWNNAPEPDPAWIKQHWGVTYSVGTQISTDVLGFVQEKVAGNKKVSFVLADTFMRAQTLKFYSSEFTTAASRPQLIVNGVTYYATEDAYIQGGTQAAVTHGTGTDLNVRDDYGDCSSTYNGGMEFDIMESLGIDGANSTYHTMHWDGYGADHQSISGGLETFPATADGFHTYGMYWQNGVAEFYVDGVQTYTYSNARVATVPAYMLLSMQLGGWGANTPGAQVNNQVFQVDYARAWSGTKIVGTTYESEDVAYTASGATTSVISDVYGTGGEWIKLNGDSVGDYYQFTIPVTAGSRTIGIRYKTDSSRAKIRLRIVEDNSLVGSEIDQYVSGVGSFKYATIGTKTFSVTGNKTFRFEVSGRNAGNTTGYTICIDSITVQ